LSVRESLEQEKKNLGHRSVESLQKMEEIVTYFNECTGGLIANITTFSKRYETMIDVEDIEEVSLYTCYHVIMKGMELGDISNLMVGGPPKFITTKFYISTQEEVGNISKERIDAIASGTYACTSQQLMPPPEMTTDTQPTKKTLRRF